MSIEKTVRRRLMFGYVLDKLGLTKEFLGGRVVEPVRFLNQAEDNAEDIKDSDEIDSEKNEIAVYGPIVDDESRVWMSWSDIEAMSGPYFRRLLKDMDGDVTVRIDSPGGDVSQASMIQGAIVEYINDGKGNVNGIIEGMAFSAASIITLPMSHIAMYQLAETMIHGPQGFMAGDLRDFQAYSTRLESMENEIIKAYADMMDEGEEEVRQMVEDTTFFTSSEAKNVGLIDEIIKTSSATKNKGKKDNSTKNNGTEGSLKNQEPSKSDDNQTDGDNHLEHQHRVGRLTMMLR